MELVLYGFCLDNREGSLIAERGFRFGNGGDEDGMLTQNRMFQGIRSLGKEKLTGTREEKSEGVELARILGRLAHNLFKHEGVFLVFLGGENKSGTHVGGKKIGGIG